MSTTRKVLLALGALMASCWVVMLISAIVDPHAGERVEVRRSDDAGPPAAAQTTPTPAAPPAPAVEAPPAPPSVAAPAVVDAGPPALPPLPEGTSYPGRTWTLGECEYNVRGVNVTSSVGDRFLRHRAPQGAVFVIADYSERNNSRETIHAGSFNVRLRDAQGRTFDPSSQVEVALNMDVLPELQPGVTRSMRVGFEVPEDVPHTTFELIFTERGLLGSDEHRVRFVPLPPAGDSAPAEPRRGRRHH